MTVVTTLQQTIGTSPESSLGKLKLNGPAHTNGNSHHAKINGYHPISNGHKEQPVFVDPFNYVVSAL